MTAERKVYEVLVDGQHRGILYKTKKAAVAFADDYRSDYPDRDWSVVERPVSANVDPSGR